MTKLLKDDKDGTLDLASFFSQSKKNFRLLLPDIKHKFNTVSNLFLITFFLLKIKVWLRKFAAPN